MKNKKISIINIIYFTAICLVAIVFLLGYLGWLKNDIVISLLIQVVVMFGIPLLMYSLLNKKKLNQTFKDVGLIKISGKMIGISIILGVVLYFINSFVADAFSGIIALFGYESLSSKSSVTINYGFLFKEFVLSCILPGFCEEFLHRGIMLHANKKHTNTKFCLIISSILFGLMHLNIRQFFYATILGFLMGYTTLVANSIIPSIIIHFMNNFLSSYFYYGTHLNWPLAQFVNFVTNIFMGNVIIFVATSTIFTILLLMLYKILNKILLKERAKNETQQIIQALQMDKLSLEEAQQKLHHVNALLKQKAIKETQKSKFNLLQNTLLIASIFLGAFLTIASFIWGVI